ncbi:MAG: hypothetical protein IJA36_07900 [Lachnospiraceae bacterium]|nr:hypothetical protein [Lachnospiraceae bacterium]
MKYPKTKMLATFFLICSLLISACNKKIAEVDYKELSYASTKEQLVQTVGSEPDEEEKAEDGSITYVYKKSKYLDYTGQMDYYSVNDAILYSRWEYVADDLEKGKKVYQEICKDLEIKYGKGEENTATFSTTFVSTGKTVIVSYLEQDKQMTISITDMEQNPNIQPTSTPKTSEKEKKANEKSENIAEKKGK